MAKKAEKTAVYMRAEDVENLLRVRFPSNAYAFLRQVNNGTGTIGGAAYADAVVFSLWPSRGLELHGIEIKVYRGDWLRELKEPGKAEHIAQFCDRWWVATSHGVVKDGELPPTWGLLEANPEGTELRVKVQAPKLTPQPLDLPFIASLFRSMAKAEDKPPVMKDWQQYNDGMRDGARRTQDATRTARAALVKALNKMDETLDFGERAFWRYRETIMQDGDGI